MLRGRSKLQEWNIEMEMVDGNGRKVIQENEGKNLKKKIVNRQNTWVCGLTKGKYKSVESKTGRGLASV